MTLCDKLETKVLRKLSKPGTASGFRRWILDASGVRPESAVIDIATAVGGMAFALLEITSDVTATDISRERIEIAKADPRANSINFIAIEAGNTPFTDKRFDIAFIVLGLHEMGIEYAKKVLQETRRISQHLVVVEFGLDRRPLTWSFLRYPLALFEPPGFLKFTRQNIGGLIENTGWTITRREADFPFELFICN
jgi:ubiquinone/menaquinone biosynthesis C-methylase UbiE